MFDFQDLLLLLVILMMCFGGDFVWMVLLKIVIVVCNFNGVFVFEANFVCGLYC